MSLSLVAMQFMANLHKNQRENSTELGRKTEQGTEWVKGKIKQIRVLKVIFLLRLHALTSMGSSTSQKVLECLAAGPEHSIKPWESPTKSQEAGRKTVIDKVTKLLKGGVGRG